MMFSKDNTLFVNLLTLITNLKDFFIKIIRSHMEVTLPLRVDG